MFALSLYFRPVILHTLQCQLTYCVLRVAVRILGVVHAPPSQSARRLGAATGLRHLAEERVASVRRLRRQLLVPEGPPFVVESLAERN